jgi:hypothetical protein
MIKQYFAAVCLGGYGLFALSQSVAPITQNEIRQEKPVTPAKKNIVFDPFEDAQMIMKQESKFHLAEREKNMRQLQTNPDKTNKEQKRNVP